jgi:hypothetical protein
VGEENEDKRGEEENKKELGLEFIQLGPIPWKTSHEPWMASVQQSFRNRDLYLFVIPSCLSSSSFCGYQEPREPMTKEYILHCLLRLVKCSLSGKYFLTFSVAASSSASGPLSKGHVTSIIRTFLSSSMTISGRRGRPESATV